MVKLIDYVMQKARFKNDESSSIRAELRANIQDNKKDIERLETELDEWKAKYWALYQGYSELRIQVYSLEDKLKSK